jgi:hypothetical protein
VALAGQLIAAVLAHATYNALVHVMPLQYLELREA